MSSPLHFLLSAFGSGGDVMPMISLGQTLRGRGHQVTIVTGGGFADIAERCGLNCVPLSSPGDYERSLKDVFLLGTRFHGLFLRRHAVAWNAALVKAAAQASRQDTVLLSAERPLMWGDLCAHLHYGLTSVRIAIDPPQPASARSSSGLVGARTQAMLAESWQAEWQRAVAPLGIGAGARHTARVARACARSVPRIAAWPKWFAPEAAKAASLQTFGFVGSPTLASAPELARPPGSRHLLVFSAGSVGTTQTWDRRFAEISRKICENSNCDGLMLGGTPPEGTPVSPSFTWKKFLPLDAVLPHAAAIIHHGGIGTAAAALQYGVPQLIVPRLFAQPSTAEWVRRLGAASVMQPDAYSVWEGTRRIAELITDPSYREASRLHSAQINPAAEKSRICDFIEEWHRRRTSRPAKPAEREVPASA